MSLKKTLFAASLRLVLISCQESDKKVDPVIFESLNEVTPVKDNPEELAVLLSDFESLFIELMGFRNNKDFKEFGFSSSGNYNDWADKAKEFQSRPNAELLSAKNIKSTSLLQLGYAYAGSSESKSTHLFLKLSEALEMTAIEKLKLNEDFIITVDEKLELYKELNDGEKHLVF